MPDMQQAFSNKIRITILAGVWVVMQAFCYHRFGIVTNLEATKYIEQAQHFLKKGSYSTGNFLFYSTQIQLIVLCLKFNLHIGVVVIAQILLNGLSIICFYRLCSRFSGNDRIAFSGTLYFLGFFYYHLYNVYLFTESVFFSLSILYAYFLFTRPSLNFRNLLVISLFLALLYFTRPTGIFFIPATLLFLVLKFFSNKAAAILSLSAVAGAGLFVVMLNRSLGSGGELDFLLPYLDEHIICGVPTIAQPHQISVPGNQNSIQGLFYIITHYPSLFLKLAAQRLIAFFGIYRPHYSLFHNAFAQGYFYLIYAIILFGAKYLTRRSRPEIGFMLALIAFTAITVAFSCDEWHNRFILAVLPFFLLLAVIAFSNLKKHRDDNKATDRRAGTQQIS